MKRRLVLVLLLVLCLTGTVLTQAGIALTYYDDWDEHDTPDTAGLVSVDGDSNIREAPNLKARIVDVAERGTEWEYLDETRYDNRGVAWYAIYVKGYIGWISSRYTRLWWPNGRW